jgi:hypothetical protein
MRIIVAVGAHYPNAYLFKDVDSDGNTTWGAEADYVGGKWDVLPGRANAVQAMAALKSMRPGVTREEMDEALVLLCDVEQWQAFQTARTYADVLAEHDYQVKLWVSHYTGVVSGGEQLTSERFTVQLSARRKPWDPYLLVSWSSTGRGARRRSTRRLPAALYQGTHSKRVLRTKLELDSWVFTMTA